MVEASGKFDTDPEHGDVGGSANAPKKRFPSCLIVFVVIVVVVAASLFMVHRRGKQRGYDPHSPQLQYQKKAAEIIPENYTTTAAALRPTPQANAAAAAPEPKAKISAATISQQIPLLHEAFISDGAFATASVRGNLGPPSVVVSPVADDWLKDRWQAAKNMKGEPIPGPHWIMLTLKAPAHNVSKVIVDFESAYSNDYAVDAFCSNSQSWESVYKSNKRDVLFIKRSKQHVTHEIRLKEQLNPCVVEFNGESLISKLRLRITKPAERWGTSVWSFLVWGYA